MWRHLLVFLLLGLAGLTCPPRAGSEQLPLRAYSASDGLAHDQINRIRQDSRGFLWLCTGDGLSRFDGYRFTNYGTHEGLSLARINDLLETRAGVYWIATNGGGVDRFNPEHGGPNDNRLFTSYKFGSDQPSNRVNVLFEDHSGAVWAGTDAGLFRLTNNGGSERFELVPLNQSKPDGLLEIQNMVEDADGSLWLASGQGVIRRFADGRTVHYSIQPSAADDFVWSILLDSTGRIWIGSRTGLVVLNPEKSAVVERSLARPRNVVSNKQVVLPAAPGDWTWLSTATGLADNNVHSLFQSRDGNVWIGTRGGGLMQFDGATISASSLSRGIKSTINSIREDNDGNIWAGSQAEGLIKITRHGLTSFVDTDGLGNTDILSIFQTNEGELCVVSAKWFINSYQAGRFVAVQPRLPTEVIEADSGGRIIQDHLGEWWVATNRGLYQFPKVGRIEELARVSPKAVYTTKEGLADDNISRLFEDSGGNIWISSYTPPVSLARWERSTNSFRRFSDRDGLPAFNWPNAFASDSSGQLWLGMHNGGLVRYRDGKFQTFTVADGVPDGIIQCLYSDQSGRLWVATSVGGAARIDNPAAEKPNFVNYTTANVLSSNNVRAFTEDQWGRVYKYDLPDVVLCDIGLPGMSGIEGIRILKEQYPEIRVLMLTVYEDDDRIFDALCAGASGYLLKRTSPARLLESMRDAVAGGAPMSPEVASKVVALFRDIRPPERADYQLTPHEVRLLKMLIDGHNYVTAAAELGVSVNGVKFHMRNIFDKLQVHSKSEAVAKALRDRIVK